MQKAGGLKWLKAGGLKDVVAKSRWAEAVDRVVDADNARMAQKSSKDDDDDSHIVLSHCPSAAMSGTRSFIVGMLEPQQIPVDPHRSLEASDELMAALRMSPKDRQYEELEEIIQYMDSITAEPFASMNEFEKLKAAMICELDDKVSHGKAVIKSGEVPTKLYVLIKGRAATFNFRKALIKFDADRRAALSDLRRKARETDEHASVDEFQAEWTEKRHNNFEQTYRLIDHLEAGTLPEGTTHEPHVPGFVCGHQVLA